MIRTSLVALASFLAGTLAAFVYCWHLWFAENARIETPRRLTSRMITTTYKTPEGVNWTATLAFSEDGRLQQVQLDCNGQTYATAPTGADFPPNAVGAYLGTYYGTNCSKGPVELTVVTLPKESLLDVPGMVVPAIFYFEGGKYTSLSVRGLEHLPKSHVDKYCPERK